ncbi:MAG: type II toxin-antitoxin system VapC family toxin [Caldilineaceae bacterium]
MRVLLDTHVFLWWIANDPQLSSVARQLVTDPQTEPLLSTVSGWEIAIKSGLGRLNLSEDLQTFVAEQLRINTIRVLPIEMGHALHVYTLPHHHRDPFDRMLVAQSQVEKIPIVTRDPLIARYAVNVIW